MDDQINKPQDNQGPVVTPPAGDTPQPVVPPVQDPVVDKPEVEPEVKPAEGVTETPVQPQAESQEPAVETPPVEKKQEGDTDTQAV